MGLIEHTPTSGVIVTGGASGIGQACGVALAEAGRPVALWDLNGAAAEKTGAEIASRFGVSVVFEELDVRDTERFPAAIDKARDALGPIGGLVHSAGVVTAIPVASLDEQAWDAVLDVNLRALALLVKALIPELRSQSGSGVVAISSINAIIGNGMDPAYGASKSGLLGLVRSLADGLAADGIRVNAVCPGYVRTPMLEAFAAETPGFEEGAVRTVMLERLAEPEEIGRTVRFLLSDDASFITAEHIVVDGGAVRSQR